MKTGGLKPQQHGGALNPGGPGRAGPGRSPSPVKRALELDAEGLLARLCAIADGLPVVHVTLGKRNHRKLISPSVCERLRALEILMRTAFGVDDE